MERIWDRNSSLRDAVGLDPRLRAALSRHAEEHRLPDPVSDAVLCCETRSVRSRHTVLEPWINPDDRLVTAAVLTPRRLGIAMLSTEYGTMTRSARLEDILLDTGDTGVAGAAELGVGVHAPWSGAGEPSTFFLGLGDDEAGHVFAKALLEAVITAEAGCASA